jgi:hypothetical protein
MAAVAVSASEAVRSFFICKWSLEQTLDCRSYPKQKRRESSKTFS